MTKWLYKRGGLIRGVISLDGDNVLVYNYLSASDI